MPERLVWMCECWEGAEQGDSFRRETESEVRALAAEWEASDPGGDLRHKAVLWHFDPNMGRWMRIEG